MSIFRFKKTYNLLPLEVKDKDIPSVILELYRMVNICKARCITSLSAPEVGINKKFFVFLKRDGTFQVVINPSFKKIGKIINVLEGSSTVEYCKEILVDFSIALTINRGFLRIEKVLKDDEAILFQKEYNIISNAVEYKKVFLQKRWKYIGRWKD